MAIVLGDHVPAAAALLKNARDWVANAVGLRIETVALTGNQHVSREEVLAIAGITGTTSLVFLEVEEARERLKGNPWIADATVLKLYPRELQITVKERAAFALWQKAGAVSVIADDGTVLEPYVAPMLLRLPLVVGIGAEAKAKELLALLDRHPALRDLLRASVLVGERRWNLRLKNGIEVRLPEAGAASALERLVALDAETKLLTRDVTVVDLRLRGSCDGPIVGCRRAGAHGGDQREAEEKSRRAHGTRRAGMSSLELGLAPKMKPLPPRRSALVAALDIGTSKIACLIGRLRPREPDDVLRHRSHAVEVLGFGHTLARGIKAGGVVGSCRGGGGNPAMRRSRRAHGEDAAQLRHRLHFRRPARERAHFRVHRPCRLGNRRARHCAGAHGGQPTFHSRRARGAAFVAPRIFGR